MINSTLKFEDILDELMLENEKPSYELLAQWTAKFPQHADALARFFATWALHPESDEVDPRIDEVSLANRGVSYAMDLLHHQQSARHATGAIPTLRLISCAEAAGLTPQRLAHRCELDESIIVKLDRCLLTNVPRVCIDRIATATGAVTEEIRTFIAGPPRRAAGGRYKAKGKPTAVTERFVDAVNASSLPESIKQFWREAVAAEYDEGDRPQ
jgi:hypothetical protein